MVEDVAKTLWLARALGPVAGLPAGRDREVVDAIPQTYGQE